MRESDGKRKKKPQISQFKPFFSTKWLKDPYRWLRQFELDCNTYDLADEDRVNYMANLMPTSLQTEWVSTSGPIGKAVRNGTPLPWTTTDGSPSVCGEFIKRNRRTNDPDIAQRELDALKQVGLSDVLIFFESFKAIIERIPSYASHLDSSPVIKMARLKLSRSMQRSLNFYLNKKGISSGQYEFLTFAELEDACTDIEDHPEDYEHCVFVEEMQQSRSREQSRPSGTKRPYMMGLATQHDYDEARQGEQQDVVVRRTSR